MKYLLNVEGGLAHDLVPVPPRPVPLAEVIVAHTFVLYGSSIFCGPDAAPHWEHEAASESALIRAWAEHLATAIEATLEVDRG